MPHPLDVAIAGKTRSTLPCVVAQSRVSGNAAKESLERDLLIGHRHLIVAAECGRATRRDRRPCKDGQTSLRLDCRSRNALPYPRTPAGDRAKSLARGSKSPVAGLPARVFAPLAG